VPTRLAFHSAPVGKVEAVIDVSGAIELAEAKLAASLPRRWRHVRSVARRARWAAKQLSLSDALVAAAWLHDIGYAPDLVETGFHPLDGARYLRGFGVDGQVVSLVAYHSCAHIEADVRGLGAELASEFSPADSLLSDLLLYSVLRKATHEDRKWPVTWSGWPDLNRRPLRPEAKFADLGSAHSRIQPGPECPPASAGVRGCVRRSSLS
jgi:hypothetical protein